MEYPTREQAQMLADEKCPEAAKYICKGCELELWCGPDDDASGLELAIECGKAFLAMHDEIDKLRGTVEVYTETILQYKEELDAKQEHTNALGRLLHIEADANNKANDELTKAHSLIRRMDADLRLWLMDAYEHDEDPGALAITQSLIAEVRAMTGEGREDGRKTGN